MSWFDDYLTGHCFDCYRYLGAHPVRGEDGQIDGFTFRVYAPLARDISVIGDFNSWDPRRGRMNKVHYAGLWELTVPGAQLGQRYKYHIQCTDWQWRDKADPVGFLMEKRPGSCSVLYNIEGYEFEDGEWMRNRTRNFDQPMSIYEMHLGSWRGRVEGQQPRYEDLAEPLIKYVKSMGYTHVEFMPLFSYPYDGSWGYQATGFFAADSRYGTPKGLMQLIDLLHQAGIGVILDIVPVHFATDPYGLERFDGSCVYEYDGDLEYSQWGSKNFDLGKDPVRSFLISSADMFCSLFHVDGIRVDAVSNIIYYGGDTRRGENSGGIWFARMLNQAIHIRHPSVMTIAEDSSAYTNVTKGFNDQGLLFDYKWDLGWMNDTLKYYSKDPIYKKYLHNNLTFSMMYFYSENFMLPLSHDEVVHGKGTILNKMWGTYDQKFSLARNLYAYQYAHPGKKLSFMGNEIGDFDEWNETRGLPWNLLGYPKHAAFQRFVRDLNEIYKFHPCMFEHEFESSTFQWVMADNSNQSVYVFRRSYGNETMEFIFNMTPNFYSYYDVGVPERGQWVEILNSDKDIYGGYNQYNGAPLEAQDGYLQGQPYHVTVKLAPFAAIYLLHVTQDNSGSREVKSVTGTGDDELREVMNGGDVRIFSNRNKSVG